MKGRFQMQGGKNWILPKERDECKPVLLGLSLAGNLVKPHLFPSMGLNAGSVAMGSLIIT
jgi:hypothetical protein